MTEETKQAIGKGIFTNAVVMLIMGYTEQTQRNDIDEIVNTLREIADDFEEKAHIIKVQKNL